MADQLRRFEILVLRPFFILFLVSAVIFLFKGMWLWGASCALGLFFLGIIGSKLHPLQSASDLAGGRSPHIESELLPPELKQMLIGHACTRMGILVGLTVGVLLWAALKWRWYSCILISYATAIVVGALLKLVFKTVGDNVKPLGRY